MAQNIIYIYRFFLYTQLEVTPNFILNAVPVCMLCASIRSVKFTGAKAVHKTLMKLRPRGNFTYILLAAFTSADPKSAKRQSSHRYLFALMGYLYAQKLFIGRTLMKLRPELELNGVERDNKVIRKKMEF